MPEPIDRLSLRSFLTILRRRWYLVLICAVAVPAVAYRVSSDKPDNYRAQSRVLFRDTGLDQGVFSERQGAPAAGQSDADLATNRDLLNARPVAVRTARRLGGGLTYRDVQELVEADNTGESGVFAITARSTDPVRSARLANAYANEFVDYRRSLAEREIREARETLTRLLRRSAAEERGGEAARETRQELRQRIAQLDVLAELQDGRVEVIERADVPEAPFEPKPRRDAAIGLGFGLLLGCLFAVLFHAVDRRVRSVDAVEDIFDRPILGAIPESRALKRSRALPAGDREAFRMLRAKLRYFHDDRDVRSVLVTSSTLGEGKSTVAWHLAAAGADAGARVLLVEADLRRPSLAQRFAIDAPTGLLHVLLGESEPGDVVHRVVVGGSGGMNGHGPVDGSRDPSMDVIFAGGAINDPVDLVESERMAALLADAHQQYDLLVVDAPPLSLVPDAIPLIRRVDGVIVVSRMGKTNRENAEHMRETLDNLGAPMLGLVVNSINRGEGYYGTASALADRYALVDRGRHEKTEE